MKARILLSCLVFTLCAAATALAEQNAPPEDFRKVSWGAELEGSKGMKPFEKKANMPSTQLDCCNRYERCYTRDGDKMSAGKAELSQIVYCATNGKFTSVFIMFPTSSFEEMKEILDYKYGSPAAGDAASSVWKWAEQEITINKMMNTLVYRNTKIRDEEKKKIEGQLKEKINDL